MTVSPLIEGESSTYGSYESLDDRRRMGSVLGRLHAATELVPTDLPRREDFALIGPRERDLRMVLDRELTGWDEYVGVAGAVSLNREAIELYRRWWDLAEIGIYTRLFRQPHERTEDTIASWENFAECLRRS